MNLNHFSPGKKLITVLVMLFIVEAAVMAMINYLQLAPMLEAVLDSSALILLAMPIIYFQFIRPMIHQYQAAVEARKTAETLRNTSMDLVRSLDLNHVMDILLKHVKGLVPFDYATLYILQSPSWLIAKAARGYTPQSDEDGHIVTGYDPQNNPTVLRVLAEQQSIALPDIRETGSWESHSETFRGGSWMGIPLIAGGKAIGLCGFSRTQIDAFTDSHIRLAEGVINQAAVAIQNAWLYEEVLSGRQQLQLLAHKMVEGQEKERRMLARDLYDEVGQAVVSVLFRLRLLEQEAGQPERLRTAVADLDRELSVIIENLHDLAVLLRPASLIHLGLGGAIQNDLDILAEKNGLKVQLEAASLVERLPESTETVLYRIFHEAVSNVVKHSGASQIDVILQLQDNLAVMVVADNGVGFNVEAVDQDRGFGLLGMRERAKMIGGELSIESAPGRGTYLTVKVPCPAAIFPK